MAISTACRSVSGWISAQRPAAVKVTSKIGLNTLSGYRFHLSLNVAFSSRLARPRWNESSLWESYRWCVLCTWRTYDHMCNFPAFGLTRAVIRNAFRYRSGALGPRDLRSQRPDREDSGGSAAGIRIHAQQKQGAHPL